MDTAPQPVPPHRGLRAFQDNIQAVYGAKDAARGVPETYMWFVEEVGELGRAIRKGDPANLREEVSDVLAWLTTLASLTGIDLEDAASRYCSGCPRCDATPCACDRGPGRE
jgi:NTP pyrophosphatase (non-canonical NTP hydrolase)